MAVKKTIAYLTPLPADPLNGLHAQTMDATYNIETLVNEIRDIAERCQQLYPITAHEFNRIERLAWIAEREVARATASATEADNWTLGNIEYRVMA